MLTSTILKRYEKEDSRFSGTDGRSWTSHLNTFIEMGKSYDTTDVSTLLHLVQWTLNPGPKMLMGKVHDQSRPAIMAISLADELAYHDSGPVSTRNARAVTRTANKIISLAKDLPSQEKNDVTLLQYLRMAIQGVDFTKVAQLSSLQTKESTFDTLRLSVQTASQVEDSYANKTKKSNVLLLDQLSPTEKEDDILDPKHLKFHRDCPGEIRRRKEGGSILDGVQKQLQSGRSTEEVLECLSFALEAATKEENEIESSHEPNESLKEEEPVNIRFATSSGDAKVHEKPDDEDEALFDNA
eukprot:IDg16681t1